MSLMDRLKKFMNSRQGQQVTQKVTKTARDPRTKEWVQSWINKSRRREH